MEQPSNASSFDAFIATALNESQQQAVIHKEGSILVVAGAGSGKTRVITARITNLILNCNVFPNQIVALTFTNKAAKEMKDRITRFLPENSYLPFIGTFHAYCLRMLRRHRDRMTVQFETILDTDDQQKIIKNLLQKHGVPKRISPKQVSFYISHTKSHSIDPDKASSIHDDRLMHELYRAYEHEKKLSHCLDFDDLLLEALKFFNAPDFVAQFQQHTRHILVDEYQDTNIVQHALLKAFCLNQKKLTIDSLCAVGDEDQSIYSWRGATVTNIRNFPTDFPDTTSITIAQNYRSVQSILDVANAAIAHNPHRIAKKLWSAKQGTNRVHCMSFASEYQEADSLAQLLLLIQKQGKLSSAALLYRAHAQSRALEEALIKKSIPYRIIGGIQFYDRMEIKDLLAYLKLIVNPFDRISCSRVLNVPARKLGAKFEELFFATWEYQPLSTYTDIAEILLHKESISGARAESLAAFIAVFDGLASTATPTSALAHIIARTHYIQHIQDMNEKDETLERIANIDELLNAFKHFEQNGITTVSQALEEITLMQDRSAYTNEEHDAVMLMTLHAAKGLEFDTVVLTGLEEGLLPTSRALHSQESIEEERRLLYVGITRASERLLLTHSKYRYTYGAVTDQIPSRFIHELPTQLVPRQEVGFWRVQEMQNFFVQWLDEKTTQIPQQSAAPSSSRPSQAILEKPTATLSHDSTCSSVSLDKKRWQPSQPVLHEVYGIGTIQTIEERSDRTYLIIQFKKGTKKISSDFVRSA